MPLFGQNWFHENIARLFTILEQRNYKIIYLSARSICQVDTTRNLIKSINQNSCTMPLCPIILNPNQLFSAFQAEVITKVVDEKISALENIKSLFGLDNNPLYAGFGNKINDFNVYKHVQIDKKNCPTTIVLQFQTKNEFHCHIKYHLYCA